MPSMSSGAKAKPAPVSAKIWGMLDTAAATGTTPKAIASLSTLGQPSDCDGNRMKWAAA